MRKRMTISFLADAEDTEYTYDNVLEAEPHASGLWFTVFFQDGSRWFIPMNQILDVEVYPLPMIPEAPCTK